MKLKATFQTVQETKPTRCIACGTMNAPGLVRHRVSVVFSRTYREETHEYLCASEAECLMNQDMNQRKSA